jgi:phosphoribosylanthranilate isomerase
VRRTLIKICGVTRPDDADRIAALDVDIIGLNFASVSPRCIGTSLARELIDAIDGRAETWGLFVDAASQNVETVISSIDLDVLQFQGDEPAEYCREFSLPYVKAIRMRPQTDVSRVAASYFDARALQLDSFVPGQAGGTGQRFDWDRWPKTCKLPLMLAGGLDPNNVAFAVRILKPWAVDVSGGVEGPHKGLKDLQKCSEFVAAVRAVDQTGDPSGDHSGD